MSHAAAGPTWHDAPTSPATPSDYSMTSGADSPRTHADMDLTLPSTVAGSPLFRLPRELRLAIFAHLLCPSPGQGKSFPHRAPGSNGNASSTTLQPSLLRLNSILHAELAPLLYGGNRLIFSHPSDANIFVRAVADPVHASQCVVGVILRIKTADVKLWTNYFNSHAAAGGARGLMADFPRLRYLGLRVRGPRWDPRQTPEGNCAAWLRDPKVVEMLPAVRKCMVGREGMSGSAVFVEICVRIPEGSGWSVELWEGVVSRLVEGTTMGEDASRRTMTPSLSRERSVEDGAEEGYTLRRFGRFVMVMGCWWRIETEGT